jgi:hypothetical protein
MGRDRKGRAFCSIFFVYHIFYCDDEEVLTKKDTCSNPSRNRQLTTDKK